MGERQDADYRWVRVEEDGRGGGEEENVSVVHGFEKSFT